MDLESPPVTPSAQVVGAAFVEQYYRILQLSPELVFRFYQESSELSRPDESGQMTSVTTMQGIDEKIQSLNYKNYNAEIKTVDAQKSYQEGVTVLVTGCLTSEDNSKRQFAQSFFLAPQDNGYFVLNDVLRFVEDDEPLEEHDVNNVEDVPIASSVQPAEPAHVPEPPAPEPSVSVVEEVQDVAKIPYETSDREIQIDNEKETPEESLPHSNGNEVPLVPESAPAPAPAQEGATKISYASIVRAPKGNSGPTKVYVPTNTAKVAVKKVEKPTIVSAPAPAVTSAPNNADVPKNEKTHEEAEGYAVYIRNLPFDVSHTELDTEFKKFGPIKGIQVRSNKQQGYCFGFVEFVSASSMNDAIQASPVTVGGRQAAVEMKRPSAPSGSGRGSFGGRRGGYQNDGSRGRGNYGGGRRNEYAVRDEFSHRGGRGSGRGEGRGRGGSH